MLEQQGALTKRSYRLHVVAHEDDRAPALRHVAHPTDAPLLELRVANREHLVDDQDLRLEECGDSEAESDVHPVGVALDRGVDVFPDTGELDNVVESLRDLAS